MTYQCPKGHQSTDTEYCSECGALIGKSKISIVKPISSLPSNKSAIGGNLSQDICPDCGTLRTSDARFCEVCRHDFQENKTGVAEIIVATHEPVKSLDKDQHAAHTATQQANDIIQPSGIDVDKTAAASFGILKSTANDDFIVSQKLNVVISVDLDKVSSCEVETAIKPDSKNRVFPLDLDENLVGRRSNSKGIYPEIEINDPGVSHRHLKFIKQSDGSFAILELGSANGTDLNGTLLEPGVNTAIQSGDELTIGIWTRLKLVCR